MTEDELQQAFRRFVAGKLIQARFPKRVDPETLKTWLVEFMDLNEHEPHIRVLADTDTGKLWASIKWD